MSLVPSTQGLIEIEKRVAEDYARRTKYPSEAAQKLLRVQQAATVAKCNALDEARKKALIEEAKGAGKR